ncbi:MAG: hypothetical protein PVF83_13365 [Anaerolineales bacterium]|jgi:hypothetical protein
MFLFKLNMDGWSMLRQGIADAPVIFNNKKRVMAGGSIPGCGLCAEDGDD